MKTTSPSYPDLINQVLDPLIPKGSPLALFDFPNYSNVGDSAIWAGQLHYLQERQSASKIIWVGDLAAARIRPLPSLPPDCIILLQGGGNFSDLWPAHQNLRQEVLLKYAQQRVIQMPQSIHFQNAQNAENTKAAFNQHPDFHLIVRDEPSRLFAQGMYECATYMCPDMALHLGKLDRPSAPSKDFLSLMRTDREKNEVSQGNEEAPNAMDWLDEPMTPTIWAEHKISKLEARYPRWISAPQSLRRHLYGELVRIRLRRGCLQLSAGRVVITDRLHAHVLCTLMGIPHVVLDNSYGKISNFRRAWGTGEKLCQTAQSIASAKELANRLLETSTERPQRPGDH